MKFIIALLIFIHGLIHFMGFAKAFDYGNMKQLTIPISKPVGVAWMITAFLFIATVVFYFMKKEYWWMVALPAVIISQVVIIMSWNDAKFGTIANVLILIVAILGWGSSQIENALRKDVNECLDKSSKITVEIFSETDIQHLPHIVQRHLKYVGALNKPKIKNMLIEFDAEMYKKPGDKPMKSHTLQYNFYEDYSRLFLMKASKMGIPFSALHIYKNKQAVFQVRVAELFKIVNVSGEELTKSETVTLLNDMCIFAPGSLTDKRLTWSGIDSLSAKVTLTNGKYVVSAILYFNELGELVNFVSDDRSALQDDGKMKQVRWTTPVSDYKEFEGRKIPTYGKTVWNYPEGDFTYGKFKLKDISYNVSP